MADVTDRGQLILIMGLVLAVALVALVPLLNTVIYTENLASRGTDVGGADALEARAVVVDGIGGLLAEENAKSYTSRGELEDNVNDGLDEFEFVVLRTRIEHGVLLEVSDRTIDDGGVVIQTDETRELTDKDDDADWTLVTDADGARDFVIEITDASALNTTDDPKNESFNVAITDGGDEWNLYVYDDGDTTIAVRNGSESEPTEVCSPSPTPRINLTNGTVDGTPCAGIDFAKGVSAPYDITYVYGNRSVGTYNVTANVTTGGNIETSNLQGAASGNSPYWEPVVYAVHVDVLYETYSLTYETRLRIVPEARA